MGSLITRQRGEAWIHSTRRWAIVTWLFLTTGITLGMGWAYTVLGWGGFWGWDPVENASLMPWITGTAFLHSVMMQEKKGMMKVWNMVLVSSTFLLSILGTTLTRTGLVQSVHAFAQSPIKPYFTTFLITASGSGRLRDRSQPAVSQERSETRERRFARIEFSVQQPDPAGKLFRHSVGHSVPGDHGGADEREGNDRYTVLLCASKCRSACSFCF